MLKTFKSISAIMGNETFGDLTENEEDQIIATQSIENLVKTLNANFEGKDVIVDTHSNSVNGLWFIYCFEADIVERKDGSRVIRFQGDNPDETVLYIEEDNYFGFDVDDASEMIKVQFMDDTYVDIYL